jgi:hypothetical protein
MKYVMPRRCKALTLAIISLLTAFAELSLASNCAAQSSPAVPNTRLAQLIDTIRVKAKALERSTGMQLGFESFLSAHLLSPDSIRYSDYVLAHLLFEATRTRGSGISTGASPINLPIRIIFGSSGET